ncbi:hypothetical protein [Actinoplanes sp. L3-i22]|uniref:hypothetical protein n=1 Tax=Actinoplanes sp. L3-i22 TaxID=2836373 RepID=UPI001C84CB1F|nr:hypothetical protein [Actinoplanes sp. L3-i22]
MGAAIRTDATVFRHGAEAMTFLILAMFAAMPVHPAPRLRRGALVAFCLLLAVAVLIDLIAEWTPVPDLWSAGGCGNRSAEVWDYRRGQLYYGWAAEAVRFLALVCATTAVRLLPRAAGVRLRLWHVVLGVVLVPLILTGLFPDYPGVAAPAPLIVTAPGMLTLVTAAVSVVLAMTRTSGRPVENVLLIAGAMLLVFAVVPAVDNLAGLDRQTQFLKPFQDLDMSCGSYNVTSPPPSMLAVATAVLLLTGPAMITWSALRPRPWARPDM